LGPVRWAATRSHSGVVLLLIPVLISGLGAALITVLISGVGAVDHLVWVGTRHGKQINGSQRLNYTEWQKNPMFMSL
jgi:hypothetical protein